MRICQTIGADDILDQRKKPIHVFAAGDASPLTLIRAAELLLFLNSGSTIAPERFDRFAGLRFVIS